MKKFTRKTRLVCACMILGGGLFRFLAALVDVAFNYPLFDDDEMDSPLSAQAWSLGFRTYC